MWDTFLWFLLGAQAIGRSANTPCAGSPCDVSRHVATARLRALGRPHGVAPTSRLFLFPLDCSPCDVSRHVYCSPARLLPAGNTARVARLGATTRGRPLRLADRPLFAVQIRGRCCNMGPSMRRWRIRRTVAAAIAFADRDTPPPCMVAAIRGQNGFISARFQCLRCLEVSQTTYREQVWIIRIPRSQWGL